jgi:hypothetical protein
MSRNRKTAVLCAIAAAAATPAMLLGGAGIAGANADNGNPEVQYSPHPGGITAHVQSFTWEPTNCTYVADGWVRQDFHLPGIQDGGFDKARADLEFPGVPLFHQWFVTISCQNGKFTSFPYWY